MAKYPPIKPEENNVFEVSYKTKRDESINVRAKDKKQAIKLVRLRNKNRGVEATKYKANFIQKIKPFKNPVTGKVYY